MKSDRLQVLVVTDSTVPKCQAECGTDWSATEHREELTSAVRAKFADSAIVAFLDMATPPAEDSVTTRRLIASKGWGVPLLLIDGERRIEGTFDIRMALDMIQVALEMRG